MNILVTGATGFIGGAVVEKLVQDGKNNVSALVRSKQSKKVNSKVKTFFGNLEDYESVNKALKGVDIVINCAGGLPYHKLSDKEYWDVNSTGVRNVVNACLKNRVKRLIHISTVGIYNRHKDAYAKSKLDAEKIIRSSKLSSKSIIIRPTICYGPRDMRPVFLRLFKVAKHGLNITIGGGDNYFHTIYIDNLVNVIIKSIKLNSILGNDFIVGDLKCHKMKEIVFEIGKNVNSSHINVNVPKNIAIFISKILGKERTIRFVSENAKYDLAKTKKYFGLKSDIEISSGIKNTYNWYKKNKII